MEQMKTWQVKYRDSHWPDYVATVKRPPHEHECEIWVWGDAALARKLVGLLNEDEKRRASNKRLARRR